jgi:hypothetical protein
MRSNHFLILLLVNTVLTACATESGGVSRRDCERLRDHVIDLRLQSVTADREQHRAALTTSLGDAFVTECASATSDMHLRCALAANDEESLAACARPRS